MNTTAKIILFPQPTSKGFPLKIRIIQDRKAVYIGLKYYLTQNQMDRFWNNSKKELRKSYPFFTQVQNELEKQKEHYGLNKSEKPVLIVNDKRSFTQYYQTYVNNLEIKKQYGLLQKANSVFLHIQEYSKELDLPDVKFRNVDIDFLNGLQLFFEKKNISAITQKGYFEKIRSIINRAIKEGKFNPQRHPFLGFEFKKANVQPKCLEPEQFKFLRNQHIPDKKIHITQQKFVFQYFAYGMRVSDLLLLRWSNIYENGFRMSFIMYKTKHQMDISLNNALLNILYEFANDGPIGNLQKKYFSPGNIKPDEYFDHIRKTLNKLSSDENTRNKRIFSKIPSDFDESETYKKIQTETSVYNKELKQLANYLNEKSKYNFKLSSHIARHTFAYLSMLNGDSVYFISKALNHQSIKTTEIYLRGFKSRQLDGKLYSKEMTNGEKNTIDSRLKELLKSADYEKKKKIIDLLSII
jgi:integrase